MNFHLPGSLRTIGAGAGRKAQQPIPWSLLQRCFLGLDALDLGYALARMLLDDVLQFFILRRTMGAALLQFQFREFGRLAAPFQIGLGCEPVIEIVPGSVATLHITVVSGFPNHGLPLLEADAPAPANVRVCSEADRSPCLSSHFDPQNCALMLY